MPSAQRGPNEEKRNIHLAVNLSEKLLLKASNRAGAIKKAMSQ